MKIFKYPIRPLQVVEIELSCNDVPINFEIGNDAEPYMYVQKVDGPEVTRYFVAFPTGESGEVGLADIKLIRYIGTVTRHRVVFAWHLYEIHKPT